MKAFLRHSLLGIAGLVLATAGLILIFSHQGKNGVVSHAAETDYTTNWNASKLYRVRYTRAGAGNNNINVAGPAIGVAQWQVTGSVNGTNFTETWDGPTADSAVFKHSGSLNFTCNPTFDATKWIVGCSGVINNDDNFALQSVDVNTFDSNAVDHLPSKVYGDGTGEACYNYTTSPGTQGTAYCLSTTGAYAFNSFFQTSDSSSSQRLQNQFSAIPLQWTVTGKITQ